jgi:caa(3)-type oxidase subunit IV
VLRADIQLTVWVVLVVATAMTAVLGLEQASAGTVAAGVALLGIAVVKARLVGIHFMELGNAPLPLRLLFEGYVALVGLVLVVLYLVV